MARKTAPRGKLAGKTALITGGNRGIGFAIAQAFAGEGCRVAITGRDKKALQAAQEKLGAGVQAFAADLSKAGAVARLFSDLRRSGIKHLDVLVNNAGMVGKTAAVAAMDEAEWQRVLATNLTAPFLVTKCALPLMHRGSIIVNNLSVAARVPFKAMSAYCASKAGLLGFTDVLREELREQGIRVVALMPGATDTAIWDQFWPEAPHGKMLSPASIAQAVLTAVALPEDTVIEELRVTGVEGVL